MLLPKPWVRSGGGRLSIAAKRGFCSTTRRRVKAKARPKIGTLDDLATMKFTPTAIDGAWIVEIDPITDDRGLFARLYDRDAFLDHGVDLPILQVNLARNDRRGTLRGMHYQAEPHGEGKLIRCVAGAAYDVIVDVRSGSKTRGRWIGVELDAENVTGKVLRLPVREDIKLPIQEQLIVELYSK